MAQELPVHVQELLAAERNKVVQAAQAGQMLLQQVNQLQNEKAELETRLRASDADSSQKLELVQRLQASEDREATMQQRLRESARSLEKLAEEERQEAERLLAENKKLRVENETLQKQSSEESNDMNAEYKKLEGLMTKHSTEATKAKLDRDGLNKKLSASVAEVNFLDRKLDMGRVEVERLTEENHFVKQELKELRIEQDSLFDSGNTDKKKAESMSKVVGALARDKAELEEALDETQQQLEESYAECDELRDALEWLEANGTQRNDGEHDLSLFDEVISIGSPGTEADSSPEPASPGLGQRGPSMATSPPLLQVSKRYASPIKDRRPERPEPRFASPSRLRREGDAPRLSGSLGGIGGGGYSGAPSGGIGGGGYSGTMNISSSPKYSSSMEPDAPPAKPKKPKDEGKAADREYFFMTMTALNLIALEDGEEMCTAAVQEQLWTELVAEFVPFHLWHTWLHARMQARRAEPEPEPSPETPPSPLGWRARMKKKVVRLFGADSSSESESEDEEMSADMTAVMAAASECEEFEDAGMSHPDLSCVIPQRDGRNGFDKQIDKLIFE